MEILFELLFEVVLQFVGEVLLEAGFRVVGRVLANRVVRTVLAITVGFGGGYWWGARLSELGRTEPPSSLWVSIGLAGVFGTVALVKVLRGTPRRVPAESRMERFELAFTPWRWSAARLGRFALLNMALAAGIAVGFDPRPLT